MSTPDLTSGTVMNQAASLNNDSAKSVYTYPVQLPYLNQALQELQEYFELNQVPVVETTSTFITIPADTDHVGFALTDPKLPNDLIEPKMLWERLYNVNPYVPMTRVDILPIYMEGVEISQFQFYTWESQEIRFLAANQINQLKMNYTKNLFAAFTDANGGDEVNVINAASFLEYRTAGLLAEFVGEDKLRAASLNSAASLALDRAIGIGTKGRQAIMTRHRPFRSSYKSRNSS